MDGLSVYLSVHAYIMPRTGGLLLKRQVEPAPSAVLLLVIENALEAPKKPTIIKKNPLNIIKYWNMLCPVCPLMIFAMNILFLFPPFSLSSCLTSNYMSNFRF